MFSRIDRAFSRARLMHEEIEFGFFSSNTRKLAIRAPMCRRAEATNSFASAVSPTRKIRSGPLQNCRSTSSGKSPTSSSEFTFTVNTRATCSARSTYRDIQYADSATRESKGRGGRFTGDVIVSIVIALPGNWQLATNNSQLVFEHPRILRPPALRRVHPQRPAPQRHPRQPPRHDHDLLAVQNIWPQIPPPPLDVRQRRPVLPVHHRRVLTQLHDRLRDE